MKFVKTATAALMCILLLCSCTNNLKYDQTQNLYIDRKTGEGYVDAPLCYEAREIGDKYAKLRNDYTTIDFFTMEGADPLLWITEEGKTIFYNRDKVTLPDLVDMEINEIMLCVEGDTLYAVVDIVKSDHISAVIAEWESGESIEYTATTPSCHYSVKFASDKYPFMYYSLVYVEYSDGAYLYCRDTGRCVTAGEVISGYLDGSLE